MISEFFDYKEDNGLVLCQDFVMAKNHSEKLYLFEAKKLGVDAVLFRRYYRDDERVPFRSEPAVCIFNKDDSFYNTNEHIKLHSALWSASKNEVYVVKGTTRIDIINARKPAERLRDHELSIENICLASGAINEFDFKRFSAHLFTTGTFWEQKELENQLDERFSPYIYLLDYLMTTRNLLLADTGFDLEPETIDKLLVTSILIKFLEEREDDHGKHTLRNIYEKYEVENFSEAIEKSLCLTIFNELAKEFNGKIFDKFIESEKEAINKTNLSLLASFLRGNINLSSKQYFIWEQYNFKYLPAEVISAIYENFIQAESLRLSGITEKGVVYTPIHLVNFLIDEVMPLDKPELFKDEIFKILDPTCGSGVFLVAAYKRLLQWWAINNSSNDNIIYPQAKEALKILEENIFGVDIKETATLVSIFGLTTALLDKLTPQEIWNNLKFNDLSERNIQNDNFFDWAIKAKSNGLSFNLVVGNPPFNIETGKKKQDVLSNDVLQKLEFKHSNIPNNNFPLHFFECSMLFGEKVCMIIPSNILLYNSIGQNYRTLLFTDFTVDKIFDFTHLREVLFTSRKKMGFKSEKKTGRTPVVALIVNAKPSLKKPIEHIVVKRMLASEKKIGFEIDYYDKHFVRWGWAIDETKQFIWKTNLLGGGRLFHLIYRLSLLPTLGEYCKEKVKNGGWKFNIGYIIGNPTQENKASFITGQDSIISINSDGTLEVELETSETFEATREESLYRPPYLLLKDVLGVKNIPAYLIETYKNKYLVFKRNFTGISVPDQDMPILKKIYDFFVNKHADLYRLLVTSTSSSVLVKQETYLNKEDIERLPFPEDEEYLKLSLSEELIKKDVLKYWIHLGKAITNNSHGSIFKDGVDKAQLKSFGDIFCDTLNSTYKNNGKSWQSVDVIFSETTIAYQFGYGYNESEASASRTLPNNAKELVNGAQVYQRISRIYQHIDGFDCVFLIKPYAQSYWLNSIALRDADDTFVDLKKAGY